MIFSESSPRPDTPLEAWLQVWVLSPAAQANNLNCSNREICQIIIRLASLSTKIQRIILVHSHSHRNVYVFRLKNFHPFSCLFRQDVVTQSHICIILPSFQILDVLKYDMNWIPSHTLTKQRTQKYIDLIFNLDNMEINIRTSVSALLK